MAEVRAAATGGEASIILATDLRSVFVRRPLRCVHGPGEVRLVAAGPFAVVAALMLAVHVAFGGAAAGITLMLSPASWPLAATFAVAFLLMGAGLSLLYRKGSPGEKLVAVYDAHRRRLLVPAISLDVEREAIGGLEYRVSRVRDDDGGVNRVEPFFAQLILRRRGGLGVSASSAPGSSHRPAG